MAIIKTRKKVNPFVQIDKTGIEDSELSWGATGLLTYIIGRPDNWEINLNHLSGVKKDKRTATTTALHELREKNYCHYFEIRRGGRVCETIYNIHETPTSYLESQEMIELQEDETILYKKVKSKKTIENTDVSPESDFLKTVNLKSEKQTLIIKELNNKRNNNKNHVHEKKRDFIDIFDKLFKEFGINYTNTNQSSVKKLLKTMSESEVITYLTETHKALSENKDIQNLAGAFSKKIAEGTRQVNPKPKKEKDCSKQEVEAIQENPKIAKVIETVLEPVVPKEAETDPKKELQIAIGKITLALIKARKQNLNVKLESIETLEAAAEFILEHNLKVS